MKKRGRIFLSAFLIATFLCTAVFATVSHTDVTVFYNYIKIVIDGDEITPKDANGKIVEPFIIEGTTYLPVRAVSEALGKDVKWDGDTNTVSITSKSNTDGSKTATQPNYESYSAGSKVVTVYFNNIKIVIDGEEITPKDANGKIVEPFIIDGTTYLPVRAVSEAFGKDVKWDGGTNTVSITSKTEPPVVVDDYITIKGQKYSTSLKELDLSSLELENADIEQLKYMTNLTDLYLLGNQISDLSPLSELTDLNWLFLNDNQISDISALKDLKNLVGLGLSGNQISDVSALKELSNLTELNLVDNPISQAQIDELQAALPDCDIFFD